MLTCSSLTFRINRMLAELWKKDKFGLKTVNHDIWRERERDREGGEKEMNGELASMVEHVKLLEWKK